MPTSRSPRIEPSTPCPCGSGLRPKRCCELDWSTLASAAPSAGALAPAQAALQKGSAADAERLVIDRLECAPFDIESLGLLVQIRQAQDQTVAVGALLSRIVRIDPNHLGATQALALLLFGKRALAEAEVHARNAVRIAPIDAQSHNLMGMIMTEAQRPHVGEHHYRRVLELLGEQNPIVLANLAWNLKNQGRMAEARSLYEQSVQLAPEVFQTLLGWARLEETDGNFARAAELLDAAEAVSPGHPSVLITRAVVQGRTGERSAALATLDRIERSSESGLGPVEWSEKGRLLDRIGRADEAFAAFTESKRTLRVLTGLSYQAEQARSDVERLRAFFTASRLKLLPKATPRSDVPQPIFVVGFPRSGTTMI